MALKQKKEAGERPPSETVPHLLKEAPVSHAGAFFYFLLYEKVWKWYNQRWMNLRKIPL